MSAQENTQLRILQPADTAQAKAHDISDGKAALVERVRALNGTLVTRFTVIRMPTLDEAQLCELLRADVPGAAQENIRRCVGLFLDLNAKAVNGEISTNSVDLRGMIAALRLMADGMAPNEAIAVSITNKCFDEYEYALVRDVVMTRFA